MSDSNINKQAIDDYFDKIDAENRITIKTDGSVTQEIVDAIMQETHIVGRHIKQAYQDHKSQVEIATKIGQKEGLGLALDIINKILNKDPSLQDNVNA